MLPLLKTPTKRTRSQVSSCKLPKQVSSNDSCHQINYAKTLLSSSFVDVLIGRDDEYRKLYGILKIALEQSCSNTVYISGPAGTGKTLTTNTVLNDLRSDNSLKFKSISLNCMSFQNGPDFYEKILSNFSTSSSKAKRKHDAPPSTSSTPATFNAIQDSIAKSKSMVILILDEIDQLKTKNCEVLNNIFKLPIYFPDKVILIGIANALDFTTKMVAFKSKYFHEIRFLPYQKEQIVQIIENRLKLSTYNENVLIDRSAIEFCARKIASCSGDIRKALDVCRRAIELIENGDNNNPARNLTPFKPRQNLTTQLSDSSTSSMANQQQSKQVNIKLMMDVLNKVYGNAVDKIESQTKTFLPADQQIILCVFLIFLKMKSLREVKISEFRDLLIKICKKNGMTCDGKSESDILNMCQYLADYGYVQVIRRDIGSSLKSSSSPFKRTPLKKASSSTITLSLLIDQNEAEQLISTFHKSIILDASSYIN